MNNQQFRDLLRKDGTATAEPAASQGSLGTKRSALVPMTPRPSVTGGDSHADFARQVRERHAGLQPAAAKKKFKSSVPMGSKIASGYTDRAKERLVTEQKEAQEKAGRIAALEKQVAQGTLSKFDFDQLREKILASGDTNGPRVKGLDRSLLEKARRGEDHSSVSATATPVEDTNGVEPELDLDAELDKIGEEDVTTLERVKTEKVGVRAAASVAGVKRSRDEIMAELKAKRQAASKERATAAPVFDHRWRKVGDQVKATREIDRKGREVITTVDEDGIVKRMVRKAPATNSSDGPPSVDTSKPILGADYVLAKHDAKKSAEQEDSDDDEDIFAGAGAEYNPLGEEEADSSDEDHEEVKLDQHASASSDQQSKSNDNSTETQSWDERRSQTTTSATKRNYFNEDSPAIQADSQGPNYEAVQNIIKKAAQIASSQPPADVSEEEKLRAEKRARMLAREDRDMDDMDLGFGGSRFDDAEDGEGTGAKGRLSEWKRAQDGADDGGWSDDGGEDKKAGGKRARKPKKRKGDKNNADDVLRVLEGRRAASKK